MSQIQKKFHILSGNASIVNIDMDRLRDTLPAAVYNVDFHPLSGFSLSTNIDKFALPEVLFGELTTRVDRLMKRYTMNGEVSALLSGTKGSGKTLLAHAFCNRAIEIGKPVIVVNNDFDNPAGLKEFLTLIGDAVFIFDEFAKTFDEDSQNVMLDFFSGSSYTKRASFVIENDVTDINEFMIDRPGRVRFHFKYDKLSLSTTKEVCEHYKLSNDLTALLLNYSARSYNIGMDTLTRLIEECIIDDISDRASFTSLIDDLNIPSNREIVYKIDNIVYNGKTFDPSGLNHLSVKRNSIHGSFYRSGTHPLIKEIELVSKTDKNLAQRLAGITNQYDNEPEYIDWSDFNISCKRPVYSIDGVMTFVDRDSGIEFVVVEDNEVELGDMLSLLV